MIGAGSRGNAYARAVKDSTTAIVQAVAEPIDFKRRQFGKEFIWGSKEPSTEQQFPGWQEFIEYETDRRRRIAAGSGEVEPGVDAVFVCTLDEQHAAIIVALAPLKLHLLCEKPLATTLHDCLRIYRALSLSRHDEKPESIFSIGHVLRYSPHNVLLRKLIREDCVIGDVISIEHTEPVGWWHFSHSYVRGNWRREDVTAPSLLTKSCHDIDLILWLLASPADPEGNDRPHLPASISSSGHLTYFRRSRKPRAAGSATNCLACPMEKDCKYSAMKIYEDRHLANGHVRWPVKIVNPEIEDCYHEAGLEAAKQKLRASLAEDYGPGTDPEDIKRRPWFGRCVWECDNDVCDDQSVVMTWEDEALLEDEPASLGHEKRMSYSKTATFHMIAHTEAQCERRGVVYGTDGEVHYDSKKITVIDFAKGITETHHPKQMPGGHGGGDDGLIRQFVLAIEAVMKGDSPVETAQKRFIGCTLEDVIRSHAAVFAAEQARREKIVIDWEKWWVENVGARTNGHEDATGSRTEVAADGETGWEVVSTIG